MGYAMRTFLTELMYIIYHSYGPIDELKNEFMED